MFGQQDTMTTLTLWACFAEEGEEEGVPGFFFSTEVCWSENWFDFKYELTRIF